MNRFEFPCEPASENIVFQDNHIRISLITSRLLRVEKGSFTDLPTQTVWNRSLGPVACQFDPNGIIATDAVTFRLDLRRGKVLEAELSDGRRITDFRKGILPGTARTLDMVNGSTRLEKGILSRSGGSMMDDSRSLLLKNGNVLPRPKCSDIYYFAYGGDHLKQLKDYFRLTGPVPLIPKYALGNWWSRYKAYSQEEYRCLMQKFIDRKVPVTVATIDMDWHWVDVKERFGPDAAPGKPKTIQEVLYNLALPGWTGYSWNSQLFPDHRELLRWLHERGFRVPLNVHPSQGIRSFEDCYEDVCLHTGTDPDEKKLIPFDITDDKFLEAYFDHVHHPLEQEGVDFWWIDWQQGKRTNIPGLDPLWALNHYHTLDMTGGERRPLILSRYAGLGSHRYPLGFSGDSFCTWKSLAFQPYFTATASNAGYTWWSHDIGGHQMGVQDDELYLRWIQFGVFSPINRLHSSNSDFMGKEPWQRSWAVCHIAEEFLRLRHKLIPFLYTANHRTHAEGIPLCMPMYYAYDCQEAYQAKDQYIFGSQLLVCPITKPAHKRLGLAEANMWLPEGTWTDIFTGRRYKGGSWVRMYRDLDSIPVLAPAGAIVPMYQCGDSNDLGLDQPLDIHVWRGNGNYRLYEDDGETMAYTEGKSCMTAFEVREDSDRLTFTIVPSKDCMDIHQGPRKLRICFRDIVKADFDKLHMAHTVDGYVCTEVTVTDQPITLTLINIQTVAAPSNEELRTALLTRWQGKNLMKNLLFKKDETIPSPIRRALEEYDHLLR